MAEENKIRDTADAIKGVADAVPIYPDLLQPAVKALGKGLETVTRTALIALAPFEITVWGYETIKEFIKQEIPKRLMNVPDERIISPNPTVAGPVIEALRFAVNESALREMYANLLATSMDAETAQNAHPAFVETIRQMVADEARIVNLIAAEESVNISQFSLIHPGDPAGYYQIQPLNISRYIYIVKKSQCVFPILVPSYLDNLRRLGITQHEEAGWHELWLSPDGGINCYKRGDLSFRAPVTDISMNRMIKLLIDEELDAYIGKPIGFSALSERVGLTSFGKQFVGACISPSNQGD